MIKPQVLVTGAGGKTGGQVALQLLSKGYPVRALVRREDARSVALRKVGAEVLVVDLFDPEQLSGAMHGMQRAYFVPPFDPYMLQSAAAFIVTAREARLESVVSLTQWLASPQHPALATRQHWLVDALMTLLPDTAVTTLHPGFIADMPYMSVLGYAAQLGLFPVPARGSSRNAPPSVNDIASVAVAALTDPGKHAGKRYRPTGPELLSMDDMAAVIGRVLERRVRHVNMPLWMFYRAARMDGFDPFLLSLMGSYFRDQDCGAFAMGGPTSDVLETTGRAAESFETITRRHAARPEMRRTLGNFTRVLMRFMSVPVRAGFDPERFDERMHIPVPRIPVLSADSQAWRSERGLAAIQEVNLPARGVQGTGSYGRAFQP